MDILTDIEMSYAEFEEIYEKIGGKEISNLEEYIRHKYRQWKAGFMTILIGDEQKWKFFL